MPKDRKVRQGDCISSIAFESGLEPDYLWNLPENAELKSLRSSPDALLPGDVVHVPDPRVKQVSASTEQKATFRRKKVPAKFRVCFELDGEVRASESVKVEVDGTDAGTLTTDGDGGIEVGIAPNAKQVTVIFAAESTKPEIHEFQLGRIDPIDTPSGQAARLENLGMFVSQDDGINEAALRQSLLQFQALHELDETGEPDDATLSKLEEEYGS